MPQYNVKSPLYPSILPPQISWQDQLVFLDHLCMDQGALFPSYNYTRQHIKKQKGAPPYTHLQLAA